MPTGINGLNVHLNPSPQPSVNIVPRGLLGTESRRASFWLEIPPGTRLSLFGGGGGEPIFLPSLQGGEIAPKERNSFQLGNWYHRKLESFKNLFWQEYIFLYYYFFLEMCQFSWISMSDLNESFWFAENLLQCVWTGTEEKEGNSPRCIRGKYAKFGGMRRVHSIQVFEYDLEMMECAFNKKFFW